MEPTEAVAIEPRVIAATGDDDVCIRSREKSDWWHEHHNVPLKKDCPAAPFIPALLRHATNAMNETEKENVETVLASKNITDYDEHFYCHREYWYQRVQMPPRKVMMLVQMCWQ